MGRRRGLVRVPPHDSVPQSNRLERTHILAYKPHTALASGTYVGSPNLHGTTLGPPVLKSSPKTKKVGSENRSRPANSWSRGQDLNLRPSGCEEGRVVLPVPVDCKLRKVDPAKLPCSLVRGVRFCFHSLSYRSSARSPGRTCEENKWARYHPGPLVCLGANCEELNPSHGAAYRQKRRMAVFETSSALRYRTPGFHRCHCSRPRWPSQRSSFR